MVIVINLEKKVKIIVVVIGGQVIDNYSLLLLYDAILFSLDYSNQFNLFNQLTSRCSAL